MPAPTHDLAPVRTAIRNKIAGVAGMGNVHDYERYAKEQSALIAQYRTGAQTGNRIYGWFVSMVRVREIFNHVGRWTRDVDWNVVGYMSVDDADATEKKIAAQFDLMADAFRDDDMLGGAVTTCIIDAQGNKSGLQLDDLGHVLFAGVFCHRARASLTTRILF